MGDVLRFLTVAAQQLGQLGKLFGSLLCDLLGGKWRSESIGIVENIA
jgi:hypothetical protein